MLDRGEESGHPLLMLAVKHLVGIHVPPQLWVVGGAWIGFEDGEYTVNADEPATWLQIKQLLENANWHAQAWIGG